MLKLSAFLFKTKAKCSTMKHVWLHPTVFNNLSPLVFYFPPLYSDSNSDLLVPSFLCHHHDFRNLKLTQFLSLKAQFSEISKKDFSITNVSKPTGHVQKNMITGQICLSKHLQLTLKKTLFGSKVR